MQRQPGNYGVSELTRPMSIEKVHRIMG